MAKMIIQNARFTLGGTGYEALVKQVTIEADFEDKVTTNMDSGGWEESISGIGKYSVAIEFDYDSDDSGLLAYLWTNRGAVVAWTAKKSSASTATTNRQWSGNLRINKVTPIRGAVGDVHGASYTWPGTGALAVATA